MKTASLALALFLLTTIWPGRVTGQTHPDWSADQPSVTESMAYGADEAYTAPGAPYPPPPPPLEGISVEPRPRSQVAVPERTVQTAPLAAAADPVLCEEEPVAWRLFRFPCQERRRIDIGGWIDQGITLNGYDPLNRFNGPVTFNDRANEYQMNQFYLFAERKTDTSQREWDWGGRVDLLYGTDYRFTTAAGLEDNINAGARFYGLALPQFYADVARDDLTIRLGHFYTILGYEVVPAPNNFFYSHSYTMQYALPFTHTGALAIYKINDQWSVTNGIHRGWDRFGIGGQVGYLGGVNWTSCDKKTTGAFAITVGKENEDTGAIRTAYDMYFTRKLGPEGKEKWTYVIEHALGTEPDAAGPGATATWYSLVNYLFYNLNEHWSFGLRYEWFRDEQGVRVVGLGDPLSPAPKGFVYPTLGANKLPCDWSELSLGVNYRPNKNFTFRSEVRWDWQTPLVSGVQPAFNDYQDLNQALWANDLVFTF